MIVNQGYNKRTEGWGGDFWRVAHSVTFQHPDNPTEEDKRIVRAFFHVFSDVVPCSSCGEHFKQHMIDYPLTDEVLANKENLSRWLHEIHNIVNHGIGKPEIPYEIVATYYMQNMNVDLPRASPVSCCSNNVAYLLIGLATGLAIGGIIILSNKNRKK
jgi:hypothetical protein